jgi:CheY-like chemotaxis protein
MIIDDHADSRDVLRQMVEALGARAIVAEDGRAALGLLAAAAPDLIFCDLLMPRMDGFTFFRHVRGIALRRTPPPVVAVSVLGTPADVQRTWAAGFDGHLVKPIDFERVRDWVARLR